jgi:purine nucleosidase
MTWIHLDTDLGGDLDDLCALAMLLRWPGVEFTGITTVCENDGRRAGYVRYALHLEGRDAVTVAAGADGRDGYYRIQPGLPPEERYWPQAITPLTNPLTKALELLKHSIDRGATVIAIGPYTNLFLLDQRYPGILKEASLFLMGGYIFPIRPGYPDWGNDMDWNIQADIQSARYVLENSNPTLIPLSVTDETSLRRAYLSDLGKAGALGQLLAHQAEVFAEDEQNEVRFGQTCPGLPADTINFQHDPLACAIALGWEEGIEIEEVPLVFEEKDGWLVERIHPGGKPIRVVTKVDGPRFNQFWIDQVCRR